MAITINPGQPFGYQVQVTNTGIQHDVVVGISLSVSGAESFTIDLPWFIIFNVPSGQGNIVTIGGIGQNLPEGNYDAICRAWTGATGGNLLTPLDSVGELREGGTLDPPILDEIRKNNEMTITTGGAAVGADLISFNLTV